MGAYVNPRGVDKQVWLHEHGTPFADGKGPSNNDFSHWLEKGKLIVCLVDSGPFDAAAIAFSREELTVFTDLRDTRPKQWFVVDMDKLYSVSDLGTYLKPKKEKV